MDSSDSETEAKEMNKTDLEESKNLPDSAGHSKSIIKSEEINNDSNSDTKANILLKQKTKKGIKRSLTSPKSVIRNGTTIVDP